MLNIRRALEQPSATGPRQNLSQRLSVFVGREREISEITSVLEKHRLLTLTGSGGVGKTRLAEQVAQKVLFEFTDGVWLAELATVAEPQFVYQVVAAAVGVREEPTRLISESLFEYLGEQELIDRSR